MQKANRSFPQKPRRSEKLKMASKKSRFVQTSNSATRRPGFSWLLFAALILALPCRPLFAQGESGQSTSGQSSSAQSSNGNNNGNNTTNNNNGQKATQANTNPNTRQTNTNQNPTNPNGQPCTPVNSLEAAPAAAQLSGTTSTDQSLNNPNNSAGVQVSGTNANGLPPSATTQAPCPQQSVRPAIIARPLHTDPAERRQTAPLRQRYIS